MKLGIPKNLKAVVLFSPLRIQLSWTTDFQDTAVAETEAPIVRITYSYGKSIKDVPLSTTSFDIPDPDSGTYSIHVCYLYRVNGNKCASSNIVTIGAVNPPSHQDHKPPTPIITTIDSHQATLQNEGYIVIHWTPSANCDQYHFMWMEKSNGRWAAVEIDSNLFKISPTFPGQQYSFKAQGCITEMIGLNHCSDFSIPKDFIIPQNTFSLREFLRLSNARLTPGIRSLGSQVYSTGIRTMMRL